MAMALQKKKTNRVPMIVIGAVMMLFSAPCVLSSLHEILIVGTNVEGALIVGSFCLLTGLGGAALATMGWKKSSDATLIIDSRLENIVLSRVTEAGGQITVGRLASQTNLTLTEAELLLNELTRRGHANPMVSPSGAMEYHFPDLQDGVVLSGLDSEIAQAVAQAEATQKVDSES